MYAWKKKMKKKKIKFIIISIIYLRNQKMAVIGILFLNNI